MKPRLSLGGLLKGLGLPGFSLDAEVSHKGAQKKITAAAFVLSEESNYRSAIQHLNGSKSLYLDTYLAWCAARACGGSVFCEIADEFVPAGWKPDSDAWRKFANEQKILVMRGADDQGLLLGMSLSKMMGVQEGVISPTCHFSMRARLGKVRIRVFGKMDKTKYIKPFFATFL